MTSRALLAGAVPPCRCSLPRSSRRCAASAPASASRSAAGLTPLLAVVTSPGRCRARPSAARRRGSSSTQPAPCSSASIALVGLSASPSRPPTWQGNAELVQRTATRAHYYTALLVFWAALLAVPLAANLGAAWLLIEATTAASALLVAYSRKPRALEAAWKYLVLTSLGLGVALLGIVVLQVAQHRAGRPSGSRTSAFTRPRQVSTTHVTLVAYLLLLAGLAAKIGWAPVHNWLPDAHSEAPPPVSALLSAALLPTVLLVAWRVQQALAGASAPPRARSSSSSGSRRSRSRCRSSGARSPGSASWPTRASSTWA